MKRTLCLLALMWFPLTADAELVVIVNANSSLENLSREEVINIFMGRYRKLPDGTTAHAFDVAGDSPERHEFYQKLLGKDLADINAYWARLVFSGRTKPPRGMKAQTNILEAVAGDHSAIGYIERKNLNDHVRVVFTLPE